MDTLTWPQVADDAIIAVLILGVAWILAWYLRGR